VPGSTMVSSLGLTECGWQSPENEAIGVLKKTDPFKALLLPGVDKAARVQQRVHVAMAMRLGLHQERVALV
jgi:hypothetical protein